MDQSPNPTICLIPKPNWPTIPKRIHIQSAILPQYTGQTDTQTNRYLEEMFDDYRPLSLYRVRRRSLMILHVQLIVLQYRVTQCQAKTIKRKTFRVPGRLFTVGMHLLCNLNVYRKSCKCLVNVYTNMATSNKMQMIFSYNNSIIVIRP